MIIFWCLLGAGAGIIAGLIPGIHTNNIALLLAVSPLFGNEAMAFTLSMCMVQSFVDFVPAIFLGAPSADTFEGVLPGHQMFLQGKAYEAICLAVTGGIIAVLLGAAITPAFFLLITQNQRGIFLATPYVLVAALAIMIGTESTHRKKIVAAFVIIAAGSQGLLFTNQIFPLITGYFGIATIAYSLKEKTITTKQNCEATINLEVIKEGILGAIGGSIVAIMPGIGSNTAAGIIKTFTNKIKPRNYLTLVGSISVSNFFFSYAAIFALAKARNGALLAIQSKLLYTQEAFFFGTIIMVMAGGIGGIAALALSKKATQILSEKRTHLLSIGSILLMVVLVFAFNGTTGLIALGFATALGLFALTQKVKRSCCMAALIVPTTLFYLFILI